jgi:tetratricopeptide (TPR) repeat protein
MRKERSERYNSVTELSSDIENYLNGSPLIAGPPGAGYKLKKFVRRNRILVGGIAAVIIVLVIGVIVSTIFAVGQARARAEAQLIADFLENDVLGSADEARVSEATVSYTLDAASRNLEVKFKDKPLIKASLCQTLGETYRRLGEYKKAEQHLLRATEIYQKHLGEEHPDTLRASSNIGWIYTKQGRYHDMERLWTRILPIEQRVSGVDRQVYTMNGLAATYSRLGKYKEAESLFDKTLELVRCELGGENFWLLPYIKGNLAGVYTAQGRYEEAERLLAETVNAEWPMGVYPTSLANIYRAQGRYAKAEPLLVKALETQRQLQGDERFETLQCMHGLVQFYVDQDRYEELFNEALPIAHKLFRKEHPLTLRFVNAYAVHHMKQKHYDEAEILLNEALKGRQRELGDDHPDTLESKNDLAMLYKELEQYDKAEELLLEAAKGRRLKLGDTHPHTVESWHNLIELYEAWGKPEKAEEWREELRIVD